MKRDQVFDKFAEMMIQRMEQMQTSEWKKGWIGGAFACPPCNIRGTGYNGTNEMMLLMYTASKGWEYPIYLTFKQLKEIDSELTVTKGEKSFPVVFWNQYFKDKDGNTITHDEYCNLVDRNEDADRYFTMRSYNVFNIEQTNIKEKKPELIEKLKEKFNIQEPSKDTFGMYENPTIDMMLSEQSWICPIKYTNPSSKAFYNLVDKTITIPAKYQFMVNGNEYEKFQSGMEYYGTLLHEMAHSTGPKQGREQGIKQTEAYAREELVAELSSALCCNMMGFDHKILDNSACYLNHWVSQLKKDPKFIISVMADVNKAVTMIKDVVKFKEVELVTEVA